MCRRGLTSPLRARAQLLRAAIAEHTGRDPPALPPPPRLAAYGAVPLRQRAPLLSQLPAWFPGGGLPSDTPLVMEEYGQQCAPQDIVAHHFIPIPPSYPSCRPSFSGGGTDTLLVMEEYGQQCGPLG